MAATMIPFIFPAMLAVAERDFITAACIVASGAASAFYHAIESQKHQLSGVSATFASPRWNTIFINLDRAAAVLLALRMMQILGVYYILDNYMWRIAFAVAAMIISETVYRHEKWYYMAYHTFWHISAALLLISWL